MKRWGFAGAMIAVLLIAANLRAPISSVGPVLGLVGEDLSLNSTWLGVLAGVPLLSFAIFSPFAHTLGRKLGLERAILVALVVTLVGVIIRPWAGPLVTFPSVNLWVGTALIGAGVAVANVLLPVVIKRDFPHKIALVTALYTAIMAALASTAAGVVVTLSKINTGTGPWGWRGALLATGALLVPAIAVWLVHMRSRVLAAAQDPEPAATETAPAARLKLFRVPLAWQVTVNMGLQSLVFFVMATWLPAVSQSYGRSQEQAGIDLMVYILTGVAGSLIAPYFLRGTTQQLPAVMWPTVVALSVVGIMVVPGAMLLWLTLAGISASGCLVTALSLIGLRSSNFHTASALSAMTQSIGYLIAAFGPVMIGSLFNRTGTWALSLGAVVVICLIEAAVGYFAGRNKLVDEAASLRAS